MTVIGMVMAMAAIAGNGGDHPPPHTPISTYTREQGWGMASMSAPIPSGGRRGMPSSCRMSDGLSVSQKVPRWFGGSVM